MDAERGANFSFSFHSTQRIREESALHTHIHTTIERALMVFMGGHGGGFVVFALQLATLARARSQYIYGNWWNVLARPSATCAVPTMCAFVKGHINRQWPVAGGRLSARAGFLCCCVIYNWTLWVVSSWTRCERRGGWKVGGARMHGATADSRKQSRPVYTYKHTHTD